MPISWLIKCKQSFKKRQMRMRIIYKGCGFELKMFLGEFFQLGLIFLTVILKL